MSTTPSPVGATLPQPKSSARDESADPDLERWQRDRWAPHSFEPHTGKTRKFVRDGSFHDRTLTREEERARTLAQAEDAETIAASHEAVARDDAAQADDGQTVDVGPVEVGEPRVPRKPRKRKARFEDDK